MSVKLRITQIRINIFLFYIMVASACLDSSLPFLPIAERFEFVKVHLLLGICS